MFIYKWVYFLCSAKNVGFKNTSIVKFAISITFPLTFMEKL